MNAFSTEDAAHLQPATRQLRLSIVVPTFNEAQNVEELIARILKCMGQIPCEIIFVDDDSQDGTAALVRTIGLRDSRVRALQRIGRRGLSSACVEGMLSATAPIIAVIDADLQHDETKLPEMLAALENGGYELAIGTRYAGGGGVGDWGPQRKSMSRLATRLSRIILKHPVSDPMSGFFMLRRSLLEDTVRGLSGVGFKILLDILATKPQAVKVAEIPYTFRPRHAGESKLDSMVMWEFGMLLAEKSIGRYIPVRFLAFCAVGATGVLVHLLLLTLVLQGIGAPFIVAQSIATGGAMVSNFSINNVLTYRDRRLRGLRWWKGLATFVVACSIGAVANVGVANYLFLNQTQWLLSALSGIAVGVVWNYAVTQIYTWGGARRRAAT